MGAKFFSYARNGKGIGGGGDGPLESDFNLLRATYRVGNGHGNGEA